MTTMPKNIRRIIIAGVAVLVLALLLVLVLVLFPRLEEEPEPTEAAATEEPVYYLVHQSGNDVCRFTFNYEDGTNFVVNIQQDGNSYTYEAIPADPYFEYNTSRFRSMMFTLSTLTATSKIEEDPEDLSDYGLDNPKFNVNILYTDGSDITLYIGNETPIKNYYYCMTDKENTVYTIGNYVTGLITRQPYQYRYIDTFPVYEEDDIYSNITHFKLGTRDGTLIDIVLDEDLSMEGNISSSAYMMTAPLLSPCNEEAIEAILENVATIAHSAIVEDITADRLTEYGLDKPARLYLEDRFGVVLDLTIGTADGGSCYAVLTRQYESFQNGEIDTLMVMRYTETDFDWVDLNFMSLQIRAPWIIDIHDVDTVTYDINGNVYEMVLYEYDDVTGSGINVVRVCSHINGKDTNETNTKRIYGRTLNFRQVASISEDTVYESEAVCSITILLKDGTTHLMTFHKINERQLACVLDGTAEYYMYISNLNTLESAINRAMDDREVPLVYHT